MDQLHAKVASDLHRVLPETESAFYTRHSCAWWQTLKRVAQTACGVPGIRRFEIKTEDRETA